MIKIEVTVDEKWPVFSFTEKSVGEAFEVELTQEEYKEYCYIMYKYHELQLKLQAMYERGLRKFNHQNGGYAWPKGSSPSERYEFNVTNAAEA